MDSRKVYGQSEGPWTVGRSMDSRKVHGQSEGPWTVGRSMDSRKVHHMYFETPYRPEDGPKAPVAVLLSLLDPSVNHDILMPA
ncbi:CLUMA_CG017616, isoform A [Clunio marinus]|uniref:CLUMA_CG017616, isoform A n=1 Tax=Clunio marinus TaxID=568069 RepID=A0A1J1IWK8_9DIPT|nr:CLUMA_CG017616, isoform A [Clunio marinus]